MKRRDFESLVKWIENPTKLSENDAPALGTGRPGEDREGIWNFHTGIPAVDENLCWNVIVVQDKSLSRIGHITGKTAAGKAAVLEASRRKYVARGIPEHFVARALHTRFGWELLERIDAKTWKAFDGIVLRPRLNVHEKLSNSDFKAWTASVEKGEGWSISGPRNEAFLEIVIGKDWKKALPLDRNNVKSRTRNANRASYDGGWSY